MKSRIVFLLAFALVSTASVKGQVFTINNEVNEYLTREIEKVSNEDHKKIDQLIIDAKVAEARNDLKGAIKFYTEALEIAPFSYELLIFRANLYFKINRIRKAATDVILAIELNDHCAQAYNLLGNIHYLFDNYDLAIEAYNKSLLYDNTMAKSYYDRALAFFAISKDMLAYNDLQIALTYNYTQAAIFMNETETSLSADK